MNSEDYWGRRAEECSDRIKAAADGYIPELTRSFEGAKRELQREIEAFYARYAGENGVSLAEAMRELDFSELREFRGKLAEYERLAKKSIGTFDLQVSNLSTKARITRLQALEVQCDAILQKLYQEQKSRVEGIAEEVYTEAYYRRLFEIEQYTGFQFPFAQVDTARIAAVLSHPVSGADISTRLWRQDMDTGFKIRQTLNEMFVTGKPPQFFAEELQNIIGRRDAEGNLTGKKYEAYRLLYNEASHVSTQADMDAYRADGIGEYKFVAALSEKTCPVCGALDGRAFPVKDAKPGVNEPLMHVNCRCTTAPYFPELAGIPSTRAARDPETGKTVFIDSRDFETWKKERLAKSGESGIIKPSAGNGGKPDVHFVGKIDRKIYRVVTEDITTDEVVITERQMEHIRERHPGDFEKYAGYFVDMLTTPDYILEANKPDTAFVLKEFSEDGNRMRMILRLKTSSDPEGYKNSIITFLKIREKEWNRCIRNMKTLYKRE